MVNSLCGYMNVLFYKYRHQPVCAVECYLAKVKRQHTLVALFVCQQLC